MVLQQHLSKHSKRSSVCCRCPAWADARTPDFAARTVHSLIGTLITACCALALHIQLTKLISLSGESLAYNACSGCQLSDTCSEWQHANPSNANHANDSSWKKLGCFVGLTGSKEKA